MKIFRLEVTRAVVCGVPPARVGAQPWQTAPAGINSWPTAALVVSERIYSFIKDLHSWSYALPIR